MKSISQFICLSLLVSCAFMTSAMAEHDHHQHGTQHSHHETLQSEQPSIGDESLYNLESSWLDKDGKPIKLSSLAGRPRLIAMLYTSCKTACPMLIGDMKRIWSGLSQAEQEKLDLTFFSFDPERDTPEQLRKFATKMNLNPKTWTMLSPKSTADVNELAAALGVRYKKMGNGDYIHSNVIFLLDSAGNFVAKKEGLQNTSKEFTASIKTVLANKPSTQ